MHNSSEQDKSMDKRVRPWLPVQMQARYDTSTKEVQITEYYPVKNYFCFLEYLRPMHLIFLNCRFILEASIFICTKCKQSSKCDIIIVLLIADYCLKVSCQ